VTPSVSVVLPTRGRHLTLPGVLAPLVDDAGAEEIVVVVDGDDAPTERLLDAMAQAEPRLRRVRGPASGPAAARQAGVAAARCDVVLLMDDDMVAGAGLVTGHATYHAGAEGIVVCGSIPVEAGPEASLPTRLYGEAYDRWRARIEADPASVLDELWGGNVSLRRSDCLEVGLDSPGMAGVKGHEDREFGIRCRLAGLRGIYAPELSAEHRHVRDLAAFRVDCVELGRGRARLHRLHADVVGPLPDDAYMDGLSAPLRLVVRAGRTKRGNAAIGRALIAGIGDGTSRRALPLAKLLRRIDLARGAALG
jgi:glycosyltransferase involved in cell wall biosynthesis